MVNWQTGQGFWHRIYRISQESLADSPLSGIKELSS